MKLYPEVDLFTPMLVDFQGLDDAPTTTVIEQLKLQERIGRLGILQHFEAQVLPFVGFDPRRLGAVPLIQRAVADYGCVGVKLYPPMGFLPIGNVTARPEGMSGEDALGVDAALAELYGWCANEQVPITAHSNPTNYASMSFINYSSPERWEQVLQRWPNLRLNLGHCGWKGDGWADRIARLMATYPGLFADIGNHELADLPTTMKRLERLFAAEQTRTLGDRFMFGSDWFMVASHHGFEAFLTTVRDAFAATFPEPLDRFMGGAALSFLGFDDAGNANTMRVRQRYEKYEAIPPSWLAGSRH
jgi:predicted TIM-barrel fold metal-dependent hydrolase